MTTSIPRLDTLKLPVGESAGTEIIARLANEIFSEFRRGSLEPASVPAQPAEVKSDGGLAGAYPSVTAPIAPPVHPGVQPASNQPVHSNETPTGAHVPESNDSYAFGEPRCPRVGAGSAPGESLARTRPVAEVPAPGFSISDAAQGGYYFLSGQGVQGVSALPGVS